MQETLQMNESDSQSAENLLREIRQTNQLLDSMLSGLSSMESEHIDEFQQMLEQRAQLIDRLKVCCQNLENAGVSEHGDQIQKFWNGFRIEMTAGDEKRVALLKNKVELAAETLRTSQKKKTLLQYQRG